MYRDAQPPPDYVRPDEPLPRPVGAVAIFKPVDALIRAAVNGEWEVCANLLEGKLVDLSIWEDVVHARLWIAGMHKAMGFAPDPRCLPGMTCGPGSPDPRCPKHGPKWSPP